MGVSLVALFLTVAAASAAPSDCPSRYARFKKLIGDALEKNSQYWDTIMEKTPEGWKAYPERLIFRNATPEEAKATRKIEKFYQDPVNKLTAGLTEEVQHDVRFLSRQLVNAGWLQYEKEFTRWITVPPALYAGFEATNALWEPINDLPQTVDDLYERSRVKRDLKTGFLFAEVTAAKAAARKKIEEESQKAGKTISEKELTALVEKSLESSVDDLVKQHRELLKETLKYPPLYDAATTPLERKIVDVMKTRDYLKLPLFADIPKIAGVKNIDDLTIQDPRLADLVKNREALYICYAAVPPVVRGGSALREKVSTSPGFASVVKKILATPEYQQLSPLYFKGKISASQFQRGLMMGAYTRYEVFAKRKALGLTPLKKLDEKNRQTQEELTSGDIAGGLAKDFLQENSY